MGLFKSIFTWWDGPTWGTRYVTRFHGEEVGHDAEGNRYFRKAGKPGKGIERRWVIYDGLNEASRVPPEWHGWLHKSTDVLPSESQPRKTWETPHHANLTGTAAAWQRPGTLANAAPRARATGDYEAWSPEEA
ncbi:NADH:ubiquinone oxidoreductase subunit NDUFA12 [Sphingosinicella soli]|uniref:NADH:ubiquinone oxidoreductase subunit n=1 Tax=Sphingosinicella soli TaxID=333708 RepID=A0A7W7F6M4_9SPHN|nr:NADH:ubiquinone oxidoreductase subunit NDUFA12 [Sphingosinicella soli]MBB4632496.1 NADH:ubiquinone oxidoreductase subunit [Sphingosinicella soli]